MAIGFFITPLYETQDETEGFQYLMLTNTIIAGICVVLCYMWFSNIPPSPPSASATAKCNSEPLTTAVVALFKNSTFVILLYVFSVTAGMLWVLATVLNQLISDNYDQSATSRLGTLMVITGAIGSLPSGPILDKWKCFKGALVVTVVMVTVSVVMLILSNVPDNELGLSIACSIFGIATASMFAIALETGIEVTYPVSDEYSSMLLMVGGNVVALICLLLYSILGAEYAMYLFVILLIIGIILACSMPRDYRRIAYERSVVRGGGDV